MRRSPNRGLVAKNHLHVFVAVICAASVPGCVSTSAVTPAGNGIYVIHGRAVAPWNADKERTKALKKANAYCAKQSQHVVLHDIDERGHAALLGERATVTFECES
jgi:hypothetical protein